MGETWDTQVRVAKGVLLLNLVIALISIPLVSNWKPFVIGLTYGSLISILSFRLLALATERSIYKGHKAGLYASSRYFIRFLINGLVIYVSLTTEHINTIGTVIGLISIKPIVLKEGLFYNKDLSKKKS